MNRKILISIAKGFVFIFKLQFVTLLQFPSYEVEVLSYLYYTVKENDELQLGI